MRAALRGYEPAIDAHLISAITIPLFSGAIGYLDRVPAYLNNLYRLGLIWFSREPLEDPLDYQVLEAQPT
jgi:hypothetical protein